MVDRSDQEKEAMQRRDAVLRTSFQRIYSKVPKTDDHDRQDAYDDLPDMKTNLEVYVYRRRTIIFCNGDRRVRHAPCLFWGFGPDFCFYIQPHTCNDINSLNRKLHDVLVGQLGLKLGEKEIADVACGFKSHVLNDGDGPEMMRSVVVAEFLNEEECYLTYGVGSEEEEEDSESNSDLDEEEKVLGLNLDSDSDEEEKVLGLNLDSDSDEEEKVFGLNLDSDSDKEDDDSDSDEESESNSDNDEEEGDLEANSHLEEEEHDLVANSLSDSVEEEADDSDSSSDSDSQEEEIGLGLDSDEEEDDSESEEDDDDDEGAEARMRRMARVWRMDKDCTLTCAVCLDEFDCEVEDVVMTHCWHLFHDLCLRNWLRKKKRNGCPMCRTPIHS